MPDAKKRAGCHLSALRQCHCIGRAAGPNCQFWSEDLDGDLKRANERTAAERVVPETSYCDWDCISHKPVVVVAYGTVPCDGWCKKHGAGVDAAPKAVDGGM